MDCAAYYKNEKIVGEGIARWMAADPQNNKREHLFITSKVRQGSVCLFNQPEMKL